jgi:hypothetical protein
VNDMERLATMNDDRRLPLVFRHLIDPPEGKVYHYGICGKCGNATKWLEEMVPDRIGGEYDDGIAYCRTCDRS